MIATTLILAAQVSLVPGTAMTYTDGNIIWARNPFCAMANLIPQPQPQLTCQSSFNYDYQEIYDGDGVFQYSQISYNTTLNKAVDCDFPPYDYVPSQVFPTPLCQAIPGRQPCFDNDRDKHFVETSTLIPGFHCPNPGSALNQPTLPDGSYCQEWYGLVPDLGACEFVGYVNSAVPADPVGLSITLQ